MLKWNPKNRVSAKDLMDDPWLKMAPNYDTHMTRSYQKEWRHCTDPGYQSSSTSSSGSGDEEEVEEEMESDAGDSQGESQGSDDTT